MFIFNTKKKKKTVSSTASLNIFLRKVKYFLFIVYNLIDTSKIENPQQSNCCPFLKCQFILPTDRHNSVSNQGLIIQGVNQLINYLRHYKNIISLNRHRQEESATMEIFNQSCIHCVCANTHTNTEQINYTRR